MNNGSGVCGTALGVNVSSTLLKLCLPQVWSTLVYRAALSRASRTLSSPPQSCTQAAWSSTGRQHCRLLAKHPWMEFGACPPHRSLMRFCQNPCCSGKMSTALLFRRTHVTTSGLSACSLLLCWPHASAHLKHAAVPYLTRYSCTSQRQNCSSVCVVHILCPHLEREPICVQAAAGAGLGSQPCCTASHGHAQHTYGV